MNRPVLALLSLMAGCGAPLDLGTDIVWSTDHESGDLSAWSTPPGSGGRYLDLGAPSVTISTEQAHSGRYSAKLSSTAATPDPTASSPGGGGLYKQAQFPQEAYYSVWYLLPRAYQTVTSWTILKFETPFQVPPIDAGADSNAPDGNSQTAGDAGGASLPSDGGGPAQQSTVLSQLLDVRLQSLPSGDMTLVVFDHRQQYLESPLPNPPPIVPIGRWFQLESFYRNAGDASGHLTIWLDGTMIYDLARPTGSDPTVYFTPCSLADNLSPPSVELYVDDVAVSWTRVTPRGVLKLN